MEIIENNNQDRTSTGNHVEIDKELEEGVMNRNKFKINCKNLFMTYPRVDWTDDQAKEKQHEVILKVKEVTIPLVMFYNFRKLYIKKYVYCIRVLIEIVIGVWE